MGPNDLACLQLLQRRNGARNVAHALVHGDGHEGGVHWLPALPLLVAACAAAPPAVLAVALAVSLTAAFVALAARGRRGGARLAKGLRR